MKRDVRGEMEVDFELPTTRRGKPREIGVHLAFWTESGRGWWLVDGKVWTEEGVRLSAREKRQAIRMARALLPRLAWPAGERNALPVRPPSGPHASPLYDGLSSLARSDSTKAADAMRKYQAEADKEWHRLARLGAVAAEEARRLGRAGKRASVSPDAGTPARFCTGDVCEASKIDGVLCADDECDYETGVRSPPKEADDPLCARCGHSLARHPDSPLAVGCYGRDPDGAPCLCPGFVAPGEVKP